MKYVWIVAVMVVVTGLVGPRAESCGPFLESMLFTTYHGAPAGSFEKGRVGVLRPHFYRADLMMAYRTLSGVKMSTGESVTPVEAPSRDVTKPWTEARKTLPPPPSVIDPDNKVIGSPYQSYPNCLADAFATAAETLHRRQAQWGATSAAFKEWVHGQDQVFENCSGGPSIPAELTDGDPMLRADRRYQRAAARFYAGQYAEAASGFDAIAKETESPWMDIAPYLAARAMVRQGTMMKDEGALREAARRLEMIVKQGGGAAQGMLDFVRARLAPSERLRELGKQLMQPNQGARLQRVLTDYTTIWDHSEAAAEAIANDDDLAGWIRTFQGRGPAVEQWRTKRTIPWLIAALVSTDAKDAAVKELVAAAQAVPAGSAGSGSATYWGIRLALMSGDADGARRWADQALGAKPEAAVTDLVRSERLKLARDWTEFLRYAPRMWVATGGIDGDSTPSAEEVGKHPAAFDMDATEPLNQRVPLALWMDAAKNDLLPKALQAEIARGAWVRTILLDDATSARAMASRVAQLTPALAGEMRSYLAVQDVAAARFSAVFLILRAPGMEPFVRPGFGRVTTVMKSDPFHDNWWVLANEVREGTRDADHDALVDLYPKGPFGPAEFLPAEQRAAAQAEWRKMVDRGGNAANFLAGETIGWAASHPQDPRVPQALHLVVEATHYGTADGVKSKEYSKQAFDILHRKYPASEWTKKTKYWY